MHTKAKPKAKAKLRASRASMRKLADNVDDDNTGDDDDDDDDTHSGDDHEDNDDDTHSKKRANALLNKKKRPCLCQGTDQPEISPISIALAWKAFRFSDHDRQYLRRLAL